MGLKDQLIQQAQNGGLNDSNLFNETQEDKKEEDSLDVDSLFSTDAEEDLNLFEKESTPDLSLEEELETIDVIDIPDDNPEPEIEDIQEGSEETIFEESEPEPEPEPELEPELTIEEPTFSEPENISSIVEEPIVDFDSELKTKLLQKSKETILKDIKENYASEMFTNTLINKLIDSYLENAENEIKNSNAIFSSILDEIINSSYKHEYYTDLVKEVLESVKNDIN